MKKILILALFSCIILAQPAEEKPVPMPQDIMLEEEIPLEFTRTDCFEEIKINGSCIITLVQGEKCGFQTEEEALTIEVNRNIVSIETAPEYHGRRALKAFLFLTNLKEIRIDGSAHLHNTKKLELADLGLEVNGSGEIRLVGIAENVNIEVNGSGDVFLEDLPARTYDIELNGSGNCSVNVTKTLEAELNGSGNIYYKGNPENIDQQINGSGNIGKIEPIPK
ncbi:MAG: head GIN domain-containing protein [Candidatus Zixiibacteriota bacterium]